MERKDYYAILGVSKDASEEEIKKKYRSEAMKWHPDRWATGTAEEKKIAEDKFKDLSEAYEVLSDPQKRAEYDNPNSGFQFQGGIDPMDVFRHMQQAMGGFSFNFGDDDGFMDMGPFGRRNRVKKGSNVNANVTLTLKEAYDGGSREVDVDIVEHCDTATERVMRMEILPLVNIVVAQAKFRKSHKMVGESTSSNTHAVSVTEQVGLTTTLVISAEAQAKL